MKSNEPFADHTDQLARAEEAVSALEAKRNDRWYPAYHIAARGGWINDPNGLCYHDGRYHVFFQHHPYSPEWGSMHWGHVSGTDLVHWNREPIALAPSIEADRSGCWSGSCVTGDDGRLYAFYTGHRQDVDGPGIRCQTQCLAISDDGTHFEKKGVVVRAPRGIINFRDPKVWREGELWCMVVGQQSPERHGQVALYTSRDLVSWTGGDVIYEHPDSNVYMLECPDLFALGGKWVLCFSAMGMQPNSFVARNRNNAGYVVGSWSLGEPFVAETAFRLWDWGHNYYAPQSFEAPDGRRIQLGWITDFHLTAPQMADGWCGQMTLPRVLALRDDNVVLTPPAREVEGLFEPLAQYDSLELILNEERALCDDLTCGKVEVTLDLARTSAERVGLKVHQAADDDYLYVAWDAQIGCVVADRRCTRQGNKGYRAAPVAGNTLRLALYLDRGSVEVIVNDGETVMSELSFPSEDPRAVSILSESGTARIANLRIASLRQRD